MRRIPRPRGRGSVSADRSGIEDFLWDLSRTVLDKLDKNLATGALFSSSYSTVEPGVSSYVYAIGMSEVRVELMPRSVRQWVWRDKGQYVNQVMASCPGLADGIESLIRMLSSATPTAPGLDPAEEEAITQRAVDYLSTFVLVLTDRLLEAGSEEREGVIDIAITEFLRDLGGEATGWDIKAFIKCFWLEMESCPLAEGMVVRRPRLEDYRGRKWVEGKSWSGLKDAGADMVGTSAGTVLEMRSTPTSEATAREELEAVLDALVLFRVASLSKEHLEMRSRSVLTPRDVREEDEGRPPLFHAVLRAEDAEDLRAFMDMMVPLVHHHPFQRSLYGGRDAHTRNMMRIRLRYAPDDESVPDLGDIAAPGPASETYPMVEDTAFHLYRGAMLDLVPVEERVAKIIAGLEHLYLSDATVVDRKRAVALRTSSLLEGWSFDALKVARDIREGFKVKGELYNAGSVGMVYKEETLQLSEDLAEYLRASLVIFYQTGKALRRDELIDAADLLVQGKEISEKVANVLQTVFLNESVAQPYR